METAEAIAERLRDSIASEPFSTEQVQSLSITASVGLSALSGPGETPDLLLKRADLALYEAKKSGRNRVVAKMAA